MLTSRPRLKLIVLVVVAAVGLWMFFGSSMRIPGFHMGIIGSLLIAIAAWTSVGMVESLPRSEGEAAISPGEWQAWLGVLFMSAILIATLASVPAFNVPLPVDQNPDANEVGRNIGALLIVWLVLSHVIKGRWGNQVTSDEHDASIERRAGSWSRWVTALAVLGIALALGFGSTDRLQQISHPAIAQLLVAALLLGALTDYLVAALLYWRDRREAVE